MRRSRIHLGDDVRELAFTIDQVVYLKCRDEPVRGPVTGYKVCPDELLYAVSWPGGGEQLHYGIELTAERPLLERE